MNIGGGMKPNMGMAAMQNDPTPPTMGNNIGGMGGSIAVPTDQPQAMNPVGDDQLQTDGQELDAEFVESVSLVQHSRALDIALRITGRVAPCRNHVSSAEPPLQ